MIKKVLLAVDLGVYTPHLLQHAASLSSQYQASLVVVHAVEPLGVLGNALLHTYLRPETTKALKTTGMDAVIEQIRTKVIDILTDEYMQGGVDLPRLEGVIVRTGSVVDVILSAAEDVGADLLVLGSHPRSACDAGLGMVPQRVLSLSKWPVYLVPLVHPASWRKAPFHDLSARF